MIKIVVDLLNLQLEKNEKRYQNDDLMDIEFDTDLFC